MIRPSAACILVLSHCVKLHLLIWSKHSAKLCSNLQMKSVPLSIQRLELWVAIGENRIPLLLLIWSQPQTLGVRPRRRRMPRPRVKQRRLLASPHVRTPQVISLTPDQQA